MADDKPHRAVILTVTIEADTRQAMIDALDGIGQQIARGELTTGVSGGYNNGYIYSYVENDGPSHDEYWDQLSIYLKERNP